MQIATTKARNFTLRRMRRLGAPPATRNMMRNPHPKGALKPVCGGCHAAQVGEHAQSVRGLALQRGNAAAPDCAGCHGSAHELSAARQSFAYNLGLSCRKPYLPPYSFMENVVYWALVWGGVVMGFSGLVLWADNPTLRWFPKEVLDLATAVHLYEAVLASLAIVVWHLHLVVFDPDVYPLDTSFLNGHGVRAHGPGPAPEVQRAGRR